MNKYVTEILGGIDRNPSTMDDVLQHQPAIKELLTYAFDPARKFILPEGTPPFKPDPAPDLGMSSMNLLSVIRKLYVFCRSDLTQMKREQMFTQLLEEIHPKEAALMIAVKDQNLGSLYPELSKAVMSGVGNIPHQPVVSHATPVTKKKQPRTKNGKFAKAQ